MPRLTRLAVFAGALLILAAGTALATQSPPNRPQQPAAASHDPEAPPTADELQRAVDRLKESGITATADELGDLAAEYGLGGAVRLMAWADASGKSVAELRGMRDDGQGWGQIGHELGLKPGIGSVMGQSGEHGPPDAPGAPGAPDEDDSGEPSGD